MLNHEMYMPRKISGIRYVVQFQSTILLASYIPTSIEKKILKKKVLANLLQFTKYAKIVSLQILYRIVLIVLP